MKSLLLKDLLNLKKQLLTYLAFIVFYTIFALISGNTLIFGIVMVILVTMVPVSTFAFDEKATWDRYALTMPVSRKDVVISKYVLSYMIIVLSAFMYIGLLLASGTTINKKTVLTVLVVIGISVLYNAFLIPCILKFGTEKGRFIILMSVLGPYLIAIVINRFHPVSLPTRSYIEALPYTFTVVVALVAFLSFVISMKLYQKKEI